jgi:hypothetical protein
MNMRRFVFDLLTIFPSSLASIAEPASLPNGDNYETFCKLFDFNIQTSLQRDIKDLGSGESSPSTDSLSKSTMDLERFMSDGARFVCYAPRQTIARTGEL